MSSLALQEFHTGLNAHFGCVNGMDVVTDYGDVPAEHAALRETAAVLDLSFRSRICLVGADRAKFLHGQVTNDVNRLKAGEGCYAALVSAKGRMQSDLHIYALADELLLDFEPGLSAAVQARLDKYIIADDVQMVDVAPLYGLLSVQGPRAGEVIPQLGFDVALPAQLKHSVAFKSDMLGEIYIVNHARLGTVGFDLFVPNDSLGAIADKLIAAAKLLGGRAVGWNAFETARIEAGVPRYGVDMDETNLAPEAGIEASAISYTKGCYIGQEVIARVRTYGQVARALRGLRLADELPALPVKGDKLFKDGKEAGYVTSAAKSLAFNANFALGYVRREANLIGTELVLKTGAGESTVRVVELPFR